MSASGPIVRPAGRWSIRYDTVLRFLRIVDPGQLSNAVWTTCQYVSVHCVPAVIMRHGVTLWEQHPCEINAWLRQVSCDVITCPVSDEQAAAACHNRLFVWVTWSEQDGFFFFFLLFLFEYGKQVGWKPSSEQWVTTMRWISQPGCAFLARQRNPVHSTHTDTLNTVYGSLAGALCLCLQAWKRPEA